MVTGRLPADATQRRPDDPGPRTLGPYELLQELGRGSMGAVYLARRPGLDRLYALKLVRADGDPQTDERLRREARLASGLEHPGIVPCLDVGSDPARGLRWLAMEFVPGHTLQEVLRVRGRVPPAEAANLVAEIAEAVGAAHAAGVVHRDLKPANVLVDGRSGRPRVTDFGLARETGSALTRTGDIVGTPAYMAPEQVVGEQADARSDVWALGALLYELLTGERPVRGRNLVELARAHTGGQIVPPSQRCPVPPDLEEVCLRALQRDPAARPADGRELARALRATSAASGSSLALPAHAPGPSRAVLLASAVGVGTALLLAVGLLIDRARRGPAVDVAALRAEVRAEAQAEVRAASEALAAARAAEAQAREQAATARAALAEARREAEELARELRHACALQVEAQAHAATALGWVARELERRGVAPSLHARLLLMLGRGDQALPLSRGPWPDGAEGLEMLALRARMGLMIRDRAITDEAARELLERAAEGIPLHDLGQLMQSVGRAGPRAALMSRLLAAPPDEPTTLWLMAVLIRGEKGEALDVAGVETLLALVDRYLRLVPCDPQLLELRAVLHWTRWLALQGPDDAERSLQDLLHARQIAPIPVGDWLNPGICLVSLGYPRAATWELQEALRQDGGLASERNRARTWLGNAAMRLGDEPLAARWWDEAVANDRETASEMGEHLELASPELRTRLEAAMRGVPLSRRYQVPPR